MHVKSGDTVKMCIRDRERTGIKSLRIGYNRVFGYYIEVTRANLSLVPDDYVRKQTLVSAERFVTPELKEKETSILGAEEKLCKEEYRLFSELRAVSYTHLLVKSVGFDGAFTFIYSPRTGTSAAKMEGQIPRNIKSQRLQNLVEVQNEITKAINNSLVGSVQEILIEGPRCV